MIDVVANTSFSLLSVAERAKSLVCDDVSAEVLAFSSRNGFAALSLAFDSINYLPPISQQQSIKCLSPSLVFLLSGNLCSLIPRLRLLLCSEACASVSNVVYYFTFPEQLHVLHAANYPERCASLAFDASNVTGSDHVQDDLALFLNLERATITWLRSYG
ncbi:hypothetical protein HK096_004718, partial [Nowakowskiella sp. JEL0078]